SATAPVKELFALAARTSPPARLVVPETSTRPRSSRGRPAAERSARLPPGPNRASHDDAVETTMPPAVAALRETLLNQLMPSKVMLPLAPSARLTSKALK